ncbi:MAG: ABC transporter ATP-binding protein [Marinagarivorans sp.]|nr:ABC transporter ATP-binding protein [Marinagarivorans sp.]
MTLATTLDTSNPLSLQDLHHRFGEHSVLRGISLSMQVGEVLCLVGPSGCGKSTLLRLIAGLERVQQGNIAINGETIANASQHRRPEERDIGLVFQDFALFPHLSLLDNVTFGLHAAPRAERKTLALAMLTRIGLAERAADFPHQLSGGQQQRIALARALAPRPRLLLLDEPFSNLDVRLRHRMRLDTLHLLKTSGTASILVTHDPDDAMFMADRIALLRAGEIVQLGTPEDLYRRPNSPFAAEFFGDVNCLSGLVEHGGVQTAFGKIAAPQLANGSKAQVLIRPEAIKLTATGLSARVLESHSLGANALLGLALEDSALPPLQAQISSDNLPSIGAQVTLTLDLRGVFVFAA